VFIIKLNGRAPGFQKSPSAMFTTQGTSITLPPSMLQPGDQLFVVVDGEQRAFDPAMPLRNSTKLAWAETFSGLLTAP
jgi:hypothetical protein